jgi:hypothetical protein
MQRRIDENIAVVERNANKMARVSNRSNPLMEMLGGFAVAGLPPLWRLQRGGARRHAPDSSSPS